MRNRRENAKFTSSPAVDEEFRRLVADLRSGPAPRKSVLVISAASGEGTTRIAASLAMTVAETQQARTLVIDANLRRPAQHRLFHTDGATGLRNWDGLSEPAYQPTEFSNVFVLAAGQANNGTHEFLSSAKLAALAKRVQNDFDFVVWDCPPLTKHADAKAVAPLVDGVVVVVEADATRTHQLEYLREQLSRDGVTVLGAVINRAGRFVPRIWRNAHAA